MKPVVNGPSVSTTTANGSTPSQPIVPQYTLQGSIHFLLSEHRRFERERNLWEIEKAEMNARIAKLEGEKRGSERLKAWLERRVNMLEEALKRERGEEPIEELSEEASLVPPGLAQAGKPNVRPQSMGHSLSFLEIIDQTRDLHSSTERARSRDFLEKCLTEVTYLLSSPLVGPTQAEVQAARTQPATTAGAIVQQNRQGQGWTGAAPVTTTAVTSFTAQPSLDLPPPAPMPNGIIQRPAPTPPSVTAEPTPPSSTLNSDDEEVEVESVSYTVDRYGRPAAPAPAPNTSLPSIPIPEPVVIAEEVESPKDEIEMLEEKGEIGTSPVTGTSGGEGQGHPLGLPPSYTPSEERKEEQGDDVEWDLEDDEEEVIEVEDAQGAHEGGEEDNYDAEMRRAIEMETQSQTSDAPTEVEDEVLATEQWECRFEGRAHLSGVRAVAWVPETDKVVTGGEDGVIAVQNLPVSGGKDLKTTAIFRGHHGFVTSLAVSNGKIYSAGTDATIRVWTLPEDNNIEETDDDVLPATPDLMKHDVLVGHSNAVWDVKVSGDGRLLASAGADGMVKIWDVAGGRNKLKSSWRWKDKEEECEGVVPVNLGWVDGERIVVGWSSSEAQAEVRDAISGDVVKTLTCEGVTGVKKVVVKNGGEDVWVGYGDGVERTFSVSSGTSEEVANSSNGKSIAALAVSADGETEIVAEDDVVRFLQKTGDGEVDIWEFIEHAKKGGECVHDVAISSTGDRAASVGADGSVKVYVKERQ
ncbi:1,2-dihydroxy-3-keto-5-methylthiopentene dioxygenase [Saitoella coloradoensis]